MVNLACRLHKSVQELLSAKTTRLRNKNLDSQEIKSKAAPKWKEKTRMEKNTFTHLHR